MERPRGLPAGLSMMHESPEDRNICGIIDCYSRIDAGAVAAPGHHFLVPFISTCIHPAMQTILTPGVANLLKHISDNRLKHGRGLHV